MADRAFAVVRSASGWRGTHCVATRTIRAGEYVLSEGPLATTIPDAQLATGLPSSEPEWQLAHALLAQGRRAEWAGAFAGGRPAACTAVDSPEVRWLCAAHAAPAADVQAVYAAVANNAFTLETPLLGVNYGAAFFETAARFNHSCAPNCLSIRCGGNFFLVAAADISTGEELTHSYLPLPTLLLCKRDRTAQLHFGPACRCHRCASEPEAPPPSHAALTFPLGHAASPDGTVITEFALHCAAGRHARAIRSAAKLLSSHLFLATVRDRPLAILQLSTPLFQAFWAIRANASATLQQPPPASPGAATNSSDHPILGGGSISGVPGGSAGAGEMAMAGAAPRALAGQECLALAADLAADAYDALAAMSENTTHGADEKKTYGAPASAGESNTHGAAYAPCTPDGSLPLPSAPLSVLRHNAAILRFLLSHRARAITAPPLLSALSGLRAILGGGVGGGMAWLRDDLPFLDPRLDGPSMPTPPLALLAVEMAAALHRPADPGGSVPAIWGSELPAVLGPELPAILGPELPAILGPELPAISGPELLSLLFAEPCGCPGCPRVSAGDRPPKQNGQGEDQEQNGQLGEQQENLRSGRLRSGEGEPNVQGQSNAEGEHRGVRQRSGNGKVQSNAGGDPVIFRRCSRCRAVRYCSVECQRRDWPLHKLSCTVHRELHGAHLRSAAPKASLIAPTSPPRPTPLHKLSCTPHREKMHTATPACGAPSMRYGAPDDTVGGHTFSCIPHREVIEAPATSATALNRRPHPPTPHKDKELNGAPFMSATAATPPNTIVHPHTPSSPPTPLEEEGEGEEVAREEREEVKGGRLVDGEVQDGKEGGDGEEEEEEDVMTIPIRRVGVRGATKGVGSRSGEGKAGEGAGGALGRAEGMEATDWEGETEEGEAEEEEDTCGAVGRGVGMMEAAKGVREEKEVGAKEAVGRKEKVEVDEEETLERAWERMQASLAAGRAHRLEVQYDVAMARKAM